MIITSTIEQKFQVTAERVKVLLLTELKRIISLFKVRMPGYYKKDDCIYAVSALLMELYQKSQVHDVASISSFNDLCRWVERCKYCMLLPPRLYGDSTETFDELTINRPSTTAPAASSSHRPPSSKALSAPHLIPSYSSLVGVPQQHTARKHVGGRFIQPWNAHKVAKLTHDAANIIHPVTGFFSFKPNPFFLIDKIIGPFHQLNAHATSFTVSIPPSIIKLLNSTARHVLTSTAEWTRRLEPNSGWSDWPEHIYSLLLFSVPASSISFDHGKTDGYSTIQFPYQCYLSVNFKQVKGSVGQPSSKNSADIQPVDLSPHLIRSSDGLFPPSVTVALESVSNSSFVFSVFLCRRIPPVAIYRLMVTSTTRRISSDRVKQTLIHSTNDNDDIQHTKTSMSLKCPLSYVTMRCPVRGSECRHLQCFDLWSYLVLNEESNRWRCPVCDLDNSGGRMGLLVVEAAVESKRELRHAKKLVSKSEKNQTIHGQDKMLMQKLGEDLKSSDLVAVESVAPIPSLVSSIINSSPPAPTTSASTTHPSTNNTSTSGHSTLPNAMQVPPSLPSPSPQIFSSTSTSSEKSSNILNGAVVSSAPPPVASASPASITAACSASIHLNSTDPVSTTLPADSSTSAGEGGAPLTATFTPLMDSSISASGGDASFTATSARITPTTSSAPNSVQPNSSSQSFSASSTENQSFIGASSPNMPSPFTNSIMLPVNDTSAHTAFTQNGNSVDSIQYNLAPVALLNATTISAQSRKSQLAVKNGKFNILSDKLSTASTPPHPTIEPSSTLSDEKLLQLINGPGLLVCSYTSEIIHALSSSQSTTVDIDSNGIWSIVPSSYPTAPPAILNRSPWSRGSIGGGASSVEGYLAATSPSASSDCVIDLTLDEDEIDVILSSDDADDYL